METTQLVAPLPAGIVVTDLGYQKRPLKETPAMREAWDAIAWDDRQFELWHVTAFGWCIPTLAISSSGSRSGRVGSQQRTYAVRVDDGAVVRIGRGPHVKQTLAVHVGPKNVERLQKFLDLRRTGEGKAGEIRDRISSRRAQGALMRAAGRTSWRWNV